MPRRGPLPKLLWANLLVNALFERLYDDDVTRCSWRCQTVEAAITACVCATVSRCSATPATTSVLPVQRRYWPSAADQSPSKPLPSRAGRRLRGQLNGWRPLSFSDTSSARTWWVAWQSFCRCRWSWRHCKRDNENDNVKVADCRIKATLLYTVFLGIRWRQAAANLLGIRQTAEIQLQNRPSLLGQSTDSAGSYSCCVYCFTVTTGISISTLRRTVLVW